MYTNTIQRIESWWSRLKAFKLQWWITQLQVHINTLSIVSNSYECQHFFQTLIDSGDFNPSSKVHRYVTCSDTTNSSKSNVLNIPIRHCLAYCAIPLLKKSLDEFFHYWNTHTIRKNYGALCPSGVPDDIYSFPELIGTQHRYIAE